MTSLLNSQHSEYDPQIKSDDLLSAKSNVTQRQPKRKGTNTTEIQLVSFMSEMKAMFADFKNEQHAKVEKICTAVEEIKTQNTEIRSSIDFLSGKYETLVDQVKELMEENTQQEKYIHSLEQKLENIERSSRSTCLEIKNIPVNKSETKTVLIETITNIGKILNLNLQQQEVKDVFRINTRNPENKTVILELVSVITKDTILKAFKNYNKGPGKLTTENLKISGPPKPIFIAENLTAKMRRLFYLARVFANSNDYKYCWSSNGKIFIRARDGSPYYIIRAEADLENLNQSK